MTLQDLKWSHLLGTDFQNCQVDDNRIIRIMDQMSLRGQTLWKFRDENVARAAYVTWIRELVADRLAAVSPQDAMEEMHAAYRTRVELLRAEMMMIAADASDGKMTADYTHIEKMIRHLGIRQGEIQEMEKMIAKAIESRAIIEAAANPPAKAPATNPAAP